MLGGRRETSSFYTKMGHSQRPKVTRVHLLTTQQAFPRSAILMAILSAFCGFSRSRGRPGSLTPAAGDNGVFTCCILHVKGAKTEEADHGGRTVQAELRLCLPSDATLQGPAR